MAELLQRLLSRQRRRNPFSDVMGPDPVESQAYMDSAQGADVSMPAPVSARAPAADAGSGILLSGQRAPVRTAAYTGDGAPVVQTGMRQRSGGGCPGGVCRPQATVVQPQSMPIQTTVAPTEIEIPAFQTPSPFDMEGIANAARNAEYVLKDPSGRALELNLGGMGLSDRALTETERVNTANIDLQKEAARQSAARLASDIALQEKTADLTGQQAQVTREATVAGRYETQAALLERFVRDGGDPEQVAQALATPVAQATLNGKDGKPEAKPQAGQASAAIPIDVARTMAHSYHAIHLMVTGQQIWEAADKIQSGDVSAMYPPQRGESRDEYAARAYRAMAKDRGIVFARAADQIVTGLSQLPEWKTGSWSGVAQRLNAHVGGPFNQYMRKTYLEAQKDEIDALPEAERAAYTRETMHRADRDAGYVFEALRAETLSAFLKSRGGQYDANKTYSENLNAMPAKYFGGDAVPSSPAPVDSNTTLPEASVNALRASMLEP